MVNEKCIIQSIDEVKPNIFLLKVFSEKIILNAKSGQFCNIKVSNNHYPLLRRPFSIHDVNENSIYFLFDIVGEGTKILSEKNIGDELDIIGPLGNGFNINDDFSTAILVAGGIGVAPFPFLIKKLSDKKIVTYYGAKNKNYLYTNNLINLQISTDDGSFGYKGYVVDLLKKDLSENIFDNIKIFGCGPTPMLKALQKYCINEQINCELSIESAMACGFGICQGCPIETLDGNYKLICKDGPVFNAKEILL